MPPRPILRLSLVKLTSMDYSNYEELHALIRSVIVDNYNTATENIVYLEEMNDKNYIVYIAQLRDVLSHLVTLYTFNDIVASKGVILTQLERAKGHLERVVIDSFMKICASLLGAIDDVAPYKERLAIRAQIAERVKTLRINDTTLPFDDRKKGFKETVRLIQDVLDNLSIKMK